MKFGEVSVRVGEIINIACEEFSSQPGMQWTLKLPLQENGPLHGLGESVFVLEESVFVLDFDLDRGMAEACEAPKDFDPYGDWDEYGDREEEASRDDQMVDEEGSDPPSKPPLATRDRRAEEDRESEAGEPLQGDPQPWAIRNFRFVALAPGGVVLTFVNVQEVRTFGVDVACVSAADAPPVSGVHITQPRIIDVAIGESFEISETENWGYAHLSGHETSSCSVWVPPQASGLIELVEDSLEETEQGESDHDPQKAVETSWQPKTPDRQVVDTAEENRSDREGAPESIEWEWESWTPEREAHLWRRGPQIMQHRYRFRAKAPGEAVLLTTKHWIPASRHPEGSTNSSYVTLVRIASAPE